MTSDDSDVEDGVAPAPLQMMKLVMRRDIKNIAEGEEAGKRLEYSITEGFGRRKLEDMVMPYPVQCEASMACLGRELAPI